MVYFKEDDNGLGFVMWFICNYRDELEWLGGWLQRYLRVVW